MIGATENLPSGRSMKPGDILRARNGTTIEVINTDAEGRLVLADCLAHAVEQGAERLVDIATLTGAIVTTLGTTYAGLMGQDDEWCEEVTAAGRRAGEIVWRLPLHAEYAELIKGRTATSSTRSRTAAPRSVTAAEFLRALRRRRAVGASGHRRHRVGHRQGLRAQGRRRATACGCWSSSRCAGRRAGATAARDSTGMPRLRRPQGLHRELRTGAAGDLLAVAVVGEADRSRRGPRWRRLDVSASQAARRPHGPCPSS